MVCASILQSITKQSKATYNIRKTWTSVNNTLVYFSNRSRSTAWLSTTRSSASSHTPTSVPAPWFFPFVAPEPLTGVRGPNIDSDPMYRACARTGRRRSDRPDMPCSCAAVFVRPQNHTINQEEQKRTLHACASARSRSATHFDRSRGSALSIMARTALSRTSFAKSAGGEFPLAPLTWTCACLGSCVMAVRTDVRSYSCACMRLGTSYECMYNAYDKMTSVRHTCMLRV